MRTIGIGLGANLGEREVRLRWALDEIGRLGGNLRLASFYETEPIDCPADAPLFLNTVAVMDYDGDLNELWYALQRLEREAGRAEESQRPKNAPRPLDLDILFCDQQVLDTSDLTLPHPRMWDRLFVLEPLAELIPDFRPYPDRPSVAERVKELQEQR